MKNTLRSILLLSAVCLSVTLAAQPDETDLFETVAPIRKASVAGSVAVLNQLSNSDTLPEDLDGIVQQITQNINRSAALTKEQETALDAHLRKLEAQYQTAIECNEVELAKLLYRPDFSFDQLLTQVSETVANHSNQRPSDKGGVEEQYLPCDRALARDKKYPLHPITLDDDLPVYTSTGSGRALTLDIDGRSFKVKELSEFPSPGRKEEFRREVSWVNPFGQSESRIIEVARNRGSGPNTALRALLRDLKDLELPFSGIVLIYSSDYRFEQGYAYEKGKLDSGKTITIERDPLPDNGTYPVGTFAARQKLVVYDKDPKPILWYPLNDICYQEVWALKFSVEGSYLDVSRYLD